MPVRIYEIAKKLNLESRFVLVRAKELGISAAKVPSSSLDKITAEYLEQQLLPLAQATPPAPAHDFIPVTIIRVPDAVPDDAPVESDPPRQRHDESYSPEIATPQEHYEPVPSPDTGIGRTDELPSPESSKPAAPPAPTSMVSPALLTPAPSVVEAAAPPAAPLVAAVAAPAAPAAPVAPAVPQHQVSADVHHRGSGSAVTEKPPAPATIEPPTAPVVATPTPPVASPTPRLGEKIGSIDLSKLGYRRPGSDPRGRDGRPGATANQGATAAPVQGSPSDHRNQSQQAPTRPTGQNPPPRPTGQNPPPRPTSPQQPNRPGGQGGPQQGGQGGPARPNFGQNRPGGNFQGRPDQRFGNNRFGGTGYGGQGRGQGQPARPPGPPKSQLQADAPVIQLRPPIVVRELAEKLGRKPFQVIADLMQMGVFATVTQTIDPEVAVKICAKSGFKFETEKRDKAAHVVNVPQNQRVELDKEDKLEDLKTRPPVITIMGHVDHGKTSLLDVIRKANVAGGEAGGITQHIGAYSIAYPHPERKEEMMQLTFLDTPGHAAFSAMRARGANVTDIVVLVVAANDGVMPQTLEALAHAQAAKVPIIVAVNKCDHPGANPMRVKQQLQDKGLVPDDWGGDTLYVECSALTKQGVDKLIESILLQAELMELKANPLRKAKGNVIESGVEPGGPVATVLVRKGTLRVGDVVICGQFHGRVRAMMDDDGVRMKEAGPSSAVRVLGLNGVPEAGSEFSAVDNEKAARELAEEREVARKKSDLDGVRPRRRTLEDIFTNIDQMSAKILKTIVKADTQGSVEAICEALRKIETNKVQLEIIHSAVGAITEYDVLLASSADAVILGFHSRVDSSAAETAKREAVQIKLYAIIYELIDHVKEAMAGLLDPLLKEVLVGQGEVRKIFELSKGGKVAGCAVTTGRLVRGKMRVRRRGNIIYEGVSLTLKRFQDEVNEVRSGLECGIRLEGFDDFQEGDFIECYSVEKVAQKLSL
jgi:translation initiation factor IF-2